MLTKSDSIAQLAAALARARMKFGALGKDREAKIASKSGASYSYDYADLADTNAAVMAALNAEAIAVFQPVSLDGAHAIVTTLLAHESGEWIASTLGLPIADPHDPRAIGSAITYARRYSLQGMVAVAAVADDDDGETARGGDHEMPRTPPAPALRPRCPACGHELSQNSKTGTWFCSKARGGCGKGWPAGLPPSALAPRDIPEERAKLLERLRELADGHDLPPAERRALWDRYCGHDTTPDDVDVSALADLVAAIQAL
jgi:hypothetical protein